jgi:dTDP-4-amino-4,6-dideoxygalactose transaminase
LARRYDELLSDVPVTVPSWLSPDSHIYQSYVIQIASQAVLGRDAVLAGLRERGIEATIGTHHMPLLRSFATMQGHSRGDFPVTDQVGATAVALPMHTALTPAELETEATALRELVPSTEL